MSAPPNSKTSATSDPAGAGSGGKDGFYLQSQTKVAILAACMVLMLVASLFAALQPLNPEPTHVTPSTRFWYPHETNPYARLQFVNCPQGKAGDYACRLNSI